MNLTICDRLENFLQNVEGGVATLKQLYAAATDYPNESVRCAIYRDVKKRFKKVSKGVYMLVGSKSASLLIEGNGREMNEIEDNSIDAIITDHPWEDKKAHTSGNQPNFGGDYEKFRYTLEDFKQKFRVLKDGAYLAEFIPVESRTNWAYLMEIRRLAYEAGFTLYAKIMWRKAKEGTVNTGLTTKGVEDILIFYKGKKPRRLAPKGKPYYTNEILTYEIDIPANKTGLKSHKSEKPIAVYEYLIKMLTNENDVCLDQFGGSCNLLKAATNLNRFGIVYELFKDYVDKAVERFDCLNVFKSDSEESTEKTYDQSLQKTNVIYGNFTQLGFGF